MNIKQKKFFLFTIYNQKSDQSIFMQKFDFMHVVRSVYF